MPDAAPLLAPWANFYVMTGSAAAALTGLMFVVITLASNEDQPVRTSAGISTFSTPTVLSFGNALLVSAVFLAPWHTLVVSGWIVGLIGLWGILYLLRVILRQRALTTYHPDLEDWVWYNVAPLIAYTTIFGGAVALRTDAPDALFALGAAVVLLIFIGIRNAWDVVTFLAAGDTSEPPA